GHRRGYLRSESSREGSRTLSMGAPPSQSKVSSNQAAIGRLRGSPSPYSLVTYGQAARSICRFVHRRRACPSAKGPHQGGTILVRKGWPDILPIGPGPLGDTHPSLYKLPIHE